MRYEGSDRNETVRHSEGERISFSACHQSYARVPHRSFAEECMASATES
jgi:hypothetical protein